jgi:ribosomal protein L40E
MTVPEVAAAAALAAPTPAAEPEIPAPAPVVDDVVPQPVWQMVAPDPTADASVTPPRDAPAVPAAASAAAPDAAPQWPTTAGSANGLPFLGRPAAPQGGLEALWAQSSREVTATPAVAGRANGVVQPCVSCGLSLSANARFCRRCGTPQAG